MCWRCSQSLLSGIPLSLPPGTPGSTLGSTGHVSHSSRFAALASKAPSPLALCGWASLSSCKRSDKRCPVSALVFPCNGSLRSVSLPHILVFIQDSLGGSVFTLCCRRGIWVGEAFLLLFHLSEGVDPLNTLSRVLSLPGYR